MTSLSKEFLALGLRGVGTQLDDIVAHATKHRLGPTQLFEYLVDIEQKDRSRRSLERRTTRSRLGRFKPMTDFDWNWPTAIDREAIESALRLDFLPEARNVVLVAPQGLGKTMIAQNIVHQAILAGHSVLFVSTAKMLLDLSTKDSARALQDRLNFYSRVGLLVLDELGYLSYDNRNADLLFQIVSQRYEKKSIVLTTNLPFSEWPSVFPNAACTTALIDRVVHHSNILAIEGDSYRRRDAQTDIQSRRRKSAA